MLISSCFKCHLIPKPPRLGDELFKKPNPIWLTREYLAVNVCRVGVGAGGAWALLAVTGLFFLWFFITQVQVRLTIHSSGSVILDSDFWCISCTSLIHLRFIVPHQVWHREVPCELYLRLLRLVLSCPDLFNHFSHLTNHSLVLSYELIVNIWYYITTY